jgi:hypothetical protein
MGELPIRQPKDQQQAHAGPGIEILGSVARAIDDKISYRNKQEPTSYADTGVTGSMSIGSPESFGLFPGDKDYDSFYEDFPGSNEPASYEEDAYEFGQVQD